MMLAHRQKKKDGRGIFLFLEVRGLARCSSPRTPTGTETERRYGDLGLHVGKIQTHLCPTCVLDLSGLDTSLALM